MRYIIETDIEEDGEMYIIIYEGKPNFKKTRLVSQSKTDSSFYTYPIIYTNEDYKKGEYLLFLKPYISSHKVKVTKHYNSFEDFMADHLELFL